MSDDKDLMIDGEVVVYLADGWTLRSGVYNTATSPFTSGEYVRLVDPAGNENLYWDSEEWATDPALVMGAIINSASGLIRDDNDPTYDPDGDGCDNCGGADHTAETCPQFKSVVEYEAHVAARTLRGGNA